MLDSPAATSSRTDIQSCPPVMVIVESLRRPASSTPVLTNRVRAAAITARRASPTSSCSRPAHCLLVGPDQGTGSSSAPVTLPPGKATDPNGERSSWAQR